LAVGSASEAVLSALPSFCDSSGSISSSIYSNNISCGGNGGGNNTRNNRPRDASGTQPAGTQPECKEDASGKQPARMLPGGKRAQPARTHVERRPMQGECNRLERSRNEGGA
jgi:hypothetical protein